MSASPSKHTPAAASRKPAIARHGGAVAGSASKKLNPSRQINAGSYLVGVEDEAYVPHVLAAFRMEALTHGSSMGIAMPPVEEVVVGYHGGDHVLEALVSEGKCEAEAMVARLEYCHFANADEYNYLSSEGLPVLLEKLDGELSRTIVIACTLTLPASPLTISALHQLNARAIAKQQFLFIVASLTGNGDLSALRSACAACYRIESCEPDEDSQLAFSLEPTQSRNLFAQDGCSTKMMCSIYWKDDQRHRRYEKFIARSVQDRVLYLLIAERYLGTNIAKVLRVSASTVSRFRTDNRPTLRSDVPANWRERHLDGFDWSLQGKPATSNGGKAKSARVTDVPPNSPDGDEDFVDFEDLEEPDKQAAPPRKLRRLA